MSSAPAPPNNDKKITVKGNKRVLILLSRLSLQREVVQNQQNAQTILDGYEIPYDTLDGSEPENKDRRNELFDMSGLRGKYPQFFLVEDGTTSFLGNWEKFQEINDAGNLPDDVLEANPNVSTWERLMG